METIGIISDTHGRLSNQVVEVLRGNYTSEQVILRKVFNGDSGGGIDIAPCGLVIHAGDVGSYYDAAQWILDELEEIAPLYVVAGNNDLPDDYRINGKKLPEYVLFRVCGLRFAMMHEPYRLHAAVEGGGLMRPAFIKPMPDVLIHGHTHVLKVDTAASGAIQICPGSVSLPRGGNPPTVAIVKVTDSGTVASVDVVGLDPLPRRW